MFERSSSTPFEKDGVNALVQPSSASPTFSAGVGNELENVTCKLYVDLLCIANLNASTQQ